MTRATFEAVDHLDGTVLDTYLVSTRHDVAAAVVEARRTGVDWAATDLTRRVRVLRAWRGTLWRSATELAGLLHSESGIGFDEAMLEVVQSVEHLRWVETNAARVLGSTTQGAGLLSPEVATRTSHEPHGVVSVLMAERSGLYAPASVLAAALASGNSVVLQPAVGLTASLVAYVAALPDAASLVQVLTGDETTADLLAATPVDQAYVVGSGATASRLASRCGHALVPTVVVPVDPPVTVVAPDADVVAAAAAVARSVVSGSAALGDDWRPEVFVAPDVSGAFEQAVRGALAEATAGSSDALSALDRPKGPLARALGSRRRPGGTPQLAAIDTPLHERVVVHQHAEFGEVLERLRARPYAHVSVFSRDRGQRISEVLRASHVSINLGAVTTDGGLPRQALGARGYGPVSGDAGLRGFTRAVTTASRRRLPLVGVPADLLLATPAGRVAARLAMHLRHSLD
ncbi:MAG: aldehyde dehydrogenase family protein [Nocardioides sp.]